MFNLLRQIAGGKFPMVGKGTNRKRKVFHFPYWLAYFGGMCFDLLAFITRRKFAISAIRVKKFTQNTYFVGSNIKKTDFVPPVALKKSLKQTIDYEFVNKICQQFFNFIFDINIIIYYIYTCIVLTMVEQAGNEKTSQYRGSVQITQPFVF